MPSFDVVSELEMYEVNHAVGNTTKEIQTRFDFRGANVTVELNEKNKEIKLTGESDFQVEQVYAMLELHCIKRKIDAQCLDPQKMTASGKEMHQIIKLKDGLDSDTAKKIAKAIKESGRHPADTYWFQGFGWLSPADVAGKDGKDLLTTCAPAPAPR
mgnify:CR=1 FL=1